MKRTLVLSLLVAGAAVVVAVGSYSALAGGPAADVAGAVMGADGPDNADHAANNAANNADHGVVIAQNGDDGDDGEVGEGAQAVAQAIADTFDVSQEEVLALHADGVGFGAIFKLYLLAAAGDTTVEALMAEAESDGGFAFGKLFKEMAGEVSALSAGEDGIPKNLGQAISGAKKGDGATALAADDVKHGPPDHAKAYGRR